LKKDKLIKELKLFYRMNKQLKSLLGIILIVILFIAVSFLVQTNTDFITNAIGPGIWSIFIYIFLLILSDVVPPMTVLPFIPLAAGIWGWFFTGILNVIGWSIGAYFCFILGRKYGVGLVKNIIPIEEISKFENKIPEEHFFWSVVLLRMLLPVDVLSYALAIFSKMNLRNYMLATIIGITPFSFILSYLGEIPFYYQMIVFLVLGIILLIGIIFKESRKK